MRDLNHYLGCEIKRDRTTIITQKRYVRYVFESEGMWNCNPKATPTVPNTRLSTDDQPNAVDPVLHKQCRSILGKVGHIVNMTGPDPA
jgi:hypothetical protein